MNASRLLAPPRAQMSDSSDEQSGDEEDVAGRGFLKRWEDSDALKGTLKSGVEILLESCFKQLEQMIRNDAIALPEEVKALPTKKEKIYRLALITLRCTGWQLCQSDAATGIDAGVATLLRFVLALDPTNDAVQEARARHLALASPPRARRRPLPGLVVADVPHQHTAAALHAAAPRRSHISHISQISQISHTSLPSLATAPREPVGHQARVPLPAVHAAGALRHHVLR